MFPSVLVVVTQLLSRVWLFVSPWTVAPQAPLSSTKFQSLLKFMSIKSVMISNHLILCCSLLVLPSIFPSIRVLSSESALCIRWPKYWSFNFSISLFNEFSGWFPLGLTGLISLQSEGLSRVFSSTTVQKHQFFCTQLSSQSNSHIHTWLLEIALTIQTFVDKVMSLVFNMLSRFVLAFLPWSKHLLIPLLQSPSTVILKPKKIKSDNVSTFSPSICHEVMGPDTMILVFLMSSFKPAFSLSSFTLILRLSSVSANRVASSAYLKLLIFFLATHLVLPTNPWCSCHYPHFPMYSKA